MSRSERKSEMLACISRKLFKKVETLKLNTLKPNDRAVIIDRLLREIVEEEKIIVSEKELDLLIKEIHETALVSGP